MNQITWLALGLCLLATGCGGGNGSRGPTGNLCSKKAIPFPVELKNAQKVDLDPGTGGISDFPGTYQFQSSDIFYKNNKTGVIMHIRETKSRLADQTVTRVVCLNGLTPKTQPFRRRATVISKMEVKENNRVNFWVRDYVIGLSNKIIKDAAPADSEGFDSPKKVYDGISSEFAFYKTKAKDPRLFETRSVTKNGDESLYTVVHYRRCGFDGKECPPELDLPAYETDPVPAPVNP